MVKKVGQRTDIEELLTTAELASVLKVKPQTVREWRCKGYGPTHVKMAKDVRYRPADVRRWLEQHIGHPIVA